MLSRGLSDRVIYPHNATYAAANAYWSLVAELSPACIIIPQSTEEVSAAVRILSAALEDEPCQFAIRSGGHIPWAGAADIEGGVTIDLSSLNKVSLSEDRTVVSLGPGLRWVDVYNELTPLGLGVPGGRCGTVGVGGVVIGGGNSFFASRYGYICDNTVNFEVVLGSGEVVNANNKTYPDLFVALKGGSNNFGIVTRFDILTFPLDGIWGGIISYPLSTASQQIPAITNFVDNNVNDPYASLISLWAYTSKTGQWVLSNALEYTKPVAYAPIFKEVTSIQPQTSNSMRITNLSSVTTELDSPYGHRNIFITMNFANRPEIISFIQNVSNVLLEPFKSAPNLTWFLVFEPFPRLFTDQGLKHGPNILGLDRTKENLLLFLLEITYNDASYDKVFNTAAESIIAQTTAYVKSIGAYNEFIYLNYASKTQNPLRGYGEANVKKMMAVSKKYDPRQVFQKLVPGGYKLADVGEF